MHLTMVTGSPLICIWTMRVVLCFVVTRDIAGHGVDVTTTPYSLTSRFNLITKRIYISFTPYDLSLLVLGDLHFGAAIVDPGYRTPLRQLLSQFCGGREFVEEAKRKFIFPL